MIKRFPLQFSDLTEEAQKRLLEHFITVETRRPLAVLRKVHGVSTNRLVFPDELQPELCIWICSVRDSTIPQTKDGHIIIVVPPKTNGKRVSDTTINTALQHYASAVSGKPAVSRNGGGSYDEPYKRIISIQDMIQDDDLKLKFLRRETKTQFPVLLYDHHQQAFGLVGE